MGRAVKVSADNIHHLSDPDESRIRAHLDRLFRRVPTEYPGGMIEIAWAEVGGAIKFAEWFSCTSEGMECAVKIAAAKNREQRNVYVGVNPRRPDVMPAGRANTGDVEVAFFQFVDCDKFESLEILRKAPMPYSFAVTTGRTPHRRPHAYWEVEDPIRNMQAWSAQQAGLRDYFKGDSVIDPPRVMRLAGTINYPPQHKRERGYRTELVTIRTIYDDEEKPPTTSADLASIYRWTTSSGPNQRYDTETGEIFEESRAEGATGPHFHTRGIDPRKCIDNIDAKIDLHNNARDLIAHFVATGYSTWMIEDYLIRLLRPVSDGGTLKLIPNLIRTAREKWNILDPDEDFSSSSSDNTLDLHPIGILTPKARPPRDWLVPGRMMRRHITMTTAAPGVGKSTLSIEEAISQASGLDFLSFGIKESKRIAVINNEETQDELERRIEATCTHFQVPFEAIADQLFIYSGVDAAKIIMARLDRNGNVLPTVHAARLRELVNDLRLDAVILDPFVQLHYVDESSNEQISRTLAAMRNIGLSDHPAAIHVIHHNRKPAAGNSHQAGDMNSARGASSMGGEAHFFFTLTDMGEADGERLNIAEDDRSSFLRLDDAKGKITPPQAAKWFQRYGVMMPYGLIGEEIGVLIPHEMDDGKIISPLSVIEMLRTVQAAWDTGNPYSDAPRAAGRYLVTVMMKQMSMTRMIALKLMKDWIDNGMIATDLRDRHRNLKGLRVLKWPG